MSRASESGVALAVWNLIGLAQRAVTVTTNNDKTGYTVSTVSDKTGYALTAGSYSRHPTNTQRTVVAFSGATASHTLSAVTMARAQSCWRGIGINVVDGTSVFGDPHAAVVLTSTTNVTATRDRNDSGVNPSMGLETHETY
jgi:hypothetical protein